MRPLSRFLKAFINLLSVSYAIALFALLTLHLVGHDHQWWIAFLINFMPIYFVPLFGFVVAALVMHARLALIATAPLALVGVLIYGPLFFPKSMNAIPENPLTVITFNVSDTNQDADKVFAWLRKQDAGVVLLQEVPIDWVAPIRRALGDLYPQQVQQNTGEGYRGNMVLSRYPSDSVLTNASGSSAFQPVVIAVNDQLIAFYNISLVIPAEAPTHRPSPFGDLFLNLIFRYDDGDRNYQITQLLTDVRAQTIPYLVAGDFNMSDQTSVYGSIAGQMGDSFREAGIGFGYTWPAFQNVGLASLPALVRIDYIWHSRDFSALSATTGPYLGSDHLPVEAALARTPQADP